MVLGGLVGAMLALAGVAYQGVFRNPLADPYLLGAAAGAGLGATLAIVYGPDTAGWPVDLLPLAAFAGAIAGVVATYALGRSGGARTTATLILAGVAVAAFLTAVQTYVQQRKAETLREVYGWLLGRLTTAGWREVGLLVPYALVSTVAMLLATGASSTCSPSATRRPPASGCGRTGSAWWWSPRRPWPRRPRSRSAA